MRLYKLDNEQWAVSAGDIYIEGSYTHIRDYMLQDCGVSVDDLDFAIDEMKSKDHNAALFGINNIFLFTTKTSSLTLIKAELEAIQELRKEFHALFKANPNSLATQEAFNRLINVYTSFDANKMLDLVNTLDKRAA